MRPRNPPSINTTGVNSKVANPDSVKAAIDVLANISAEDKIVVLGSMSELGCYSRESHEEIGRYLVDKNVSRIFTFGKEARHIGKEAILQGFPPERVLHSTNRSTLHLRLKKAISPGSVILVKGSHDMNMGATARFLRHNYKLSI